MNEELAALERSLLPGVAGSIRKRRDLLAWGQHYLPHYITQEPSGLHHWLCEKFDHMNQEKNRGQRVNCLGSRETAKSTWATLVLPLHNICEELDDFIFMGGETYDQIEPHLRAIKTELEDNDALRRDYPRACGVGRLWRDGEIITRNGVRVLAGGARKHIRGQRHGASRPSLVITDDLDGDDSVFSPTVRERIRVWYNGTVLKIGSARTNFVNVANAMHREAIGMQLLERNTWHRKKFPSILQWPANMGLWAKWEAVLLRIADDENESVEKARDFHLKHKKEMDKGAVLLWPERENLYDLMTLRAMDGHNAFEREKQCNPINSEDCEWPEGYFDEHIWCDRFPDKCLVKAIGVDPSKGKDAKRGDYSAIVGIALGTDRVLYVEANLARRDTDTICFDLVEFAKRLRPDGVGLEINQFQELMGPDIHEAAAKCDYDINLIPLQNVAPKPVRIRRLGSYLSQKKIRFVKSSPGTRLCVEQMKDFPIGDHDDGPDGLEMALRTAIGLHNGKGHTLHNELEVAT